MGEQLSIDFDAAISAGQAASEACVAKADRVNPGFSEGAYGFLCQHISTLPYTVQISCETLVTAAEQAGHKPHDSRAFGQVFRRLLKENRIRRVGYGMRAKGHGAPGASIYVRAT